MYTCVSLKLILGKSGNVADCSEAHQIKKIVNMNSNILYSICSCIYIFPLIRVERNRRDFLVLTV